MLACSEPPPGHTKWGLRSLGTHLVELEIADSISRETVRQTLKERSQAPARIMLVHSAKSKCELRLCRGGRARSLQQGS